MKNQKRITNFLTVVLSLIVLQGTMSAFAAKPPKVKVSASQANHIALKKFPGKIVGKTALENEEGKWQYGVLVRSGKTLREVMVNAKTGKIDSVEVTTDAKENAEKIEDAAKAKKSSSKETEDDDKKEK